MIKAKHPSNRAERLLLKEKKDKKRTYKKKEVQDDIDPNTNIGEPS